MNGSELFVLARFRSTPRLGVARTTHSGRVTQSRQNHKLKEQPNPDQSNEPRNVVPHNITYFCIGRPALSQAAVPPAMLIVCG